MRKQNFIFLFTLSLLVIALIFPNSPLSQDNLIGRLSSKTPRIEREKAVDELLNMGQKAIPLLLSGLKSPDWGVKKSSIELLVIFKSKEAVSPLIEILKTTEVTKEKFAAAFALGRIKDKLATKPLLEILKNSENDIDKKCSVIIGLGLLVDENAIPYLKDELKNSNERIRIFAAGSLGLLNNTQGFDVALTGTYSDDPSNKMHAIQALGLIGKEEAIPRLNELLKEKPSVVNKRAINLSLMQINIRHADTNEKIQSLKEGILNNPNNTTLIKWAIEELIDIGSPQAISNLKELSEKDSSKRIRAIASQSLKLFNLKNNY